ncbi:GATA-type zinc finger protein 1 isoform X1 [Cervus elaphus]|uniref:GATA-type zinc finger protein 1 isoform X1 n=1 Tax=Cervus elaphus TaxID=9860 RepID=UPI001CC2BE18|nr:GATA-type zinc finger protein 1 isoform X1 [Cervus elaphus]
MEAEPARDFAMLRELLAPPYLNSEPPPEPPIQQTPRTPGCLRPSGRSFWPAHQDSVTALPFLQETAEELAQTPGDTQALGPYWEPKALETLGPLPLAKDAKNMLTPVNQQSPNVGPPRAPPTSPAQAQRRPRKQSNPQRSAEKVDPLFEGVTLKFQIKPDSSLQIIPSYSLACSSRSPEPPAPGPARGPEANSGGSEALAPRRCASCRTERTPLWRDAEDGTPLCNACGTRNTAPAAPAAGWCPGKMCSPRSCVADVGCPWAPTQPQLRKGKPFLTQPSLSCLSFSRGKIG